MGYEYNIINYNVKHLKIKQWKIIMKNIIEN